MPIDDDVFYRLKHHDLSLKKLHLDGHALPSAQRLRDADIIRLAQCIALHGALEEVELSHHFISDVGFAALLKCPSIKKLGLRGNQISASQVGLRIEDTLESLDLSQNPLEMHSFIELIVENRGLKSLSIEETLVGDHALLELANHPGLKSLFVSGTKLTQFGLALLAESKLSHLAYRTLTATTMHTDTAILLAQGPHLSRVFVAGMTIDGLCRRILAKRPALAFYHFDGAVYQRFVHEKVRFFRAPNATPLTDACILDYQPSLDEMQQHLQNALLQDEAPDAHARLGLGFMVVSMLACGLAYHSYQMQQPFVSAAFLIGALLFATGARAHLAPQWAPKG